MWWIPSNFRIIFSEFKTLKFTRAIFFYAHKLWTFNGSKIILQTSLPNMVKKSTRKKAYSTIKMDEIIYYTNLKVTNQQQQHQHLKWHVRLEDMSVCAVELNHIYGGNDMQKKNSEWNDNNYAWYTWHIYFTLKQWTKNANVNVNRMCAESRAEQHTKVMINLIALSKMT